MPKPLPRSKPGPPSSLRGNQLNQHHSQAFRFKLLSIAIFLVFSIVLIRLYHWQIISADTLAAAAQSQHQITSPLPAQRGKILTRDGYELVNNQPSFTVYADKTLIKASAYEIAHQIATRTTQLPPSPQVLGLMATPIATEEVALEEGQLTPTPTPTLTPTPIPDINYLISQRSNHLQTLLNQPDLIWVKLASGLNEAKKQELESLKIEGLQFEEESIRSYPEASRSAHVIGFVGANPAGLPKGFFGLEGFYDLELTGRPGERSLEKDAFGNPILIGNFKEIAGSPGRDLITHIDRALQFQVEKKLLEAIQKYGALSGTVTIMDPKTGAILAMASYPSYLPEYARFYPYETFINPVVGQSFEPGSTFKTLIMAAGLNDGVITPDTICSCRGPLRIGSYTISTWDFQYHPDSTMTQVLIHSDNIGMVDISNRLGTEKMYHYLTQFGVGEKTGIDVQDEGVSSIRPQEQWKDIDRATASFGQGIAVTPLQLLRAVAAIANDGWLMQPQIVDKIKSDHSTVDIQPLPIRQVITPQAAQTLTEMMIQSAAFGEAKFAFPKGYTIAGKTGTAQVPNQDHRGYKEDKTNASFIGFAPADNPRFAMLVTINEPTSSPWGSETAAPLWFSLAKEMFLYMGIPPQN